MDRVQIEDISQKAELILQDAPEYKMELEEFVSALYDKCGNLDIDETVIAKDLQDIVSLEVDGETEKRTATLAPLRVFAHEISVLLESHGGMLSLSSLENSFYEK